MNDRFLRACRCETVDYTPIWLMRQAGRYLPEYRRLREQYDMLTLCRTPELSATITLQPIQRFDLDAAILFSDIMIPLQGMGIAFELVEGIGPIVAQPIRTQSSADALRILEPERDVPFVLETIRLVRRELENKLPLIGFAGAPFTLASYIVEGKPSRAVLLTKKFMHEQPHAWHTLMDKLASSIALYLCAQIHAGAQAIQLFDSWVGALTPPDYATFVFPHTKKIFDALAATNVPRIHFGTGTATLLELMRDAGGDVFGIDWRIPLSQAWARLGNVALQGNLDPAVMLTTPQIVARNARQILADVNGRRGHIFNLGHGILPNTPIKNVERLIAVVHAWRAEAN
ncbi:MAG TPA: uroporphyrinogen decarboxylase [Anaerolineae bacterium]|nr:uroporphyrinogen decarboxylase [Anaerolineae bacterium]